MVSYGGLNGGLRCELQFTFRYIFWKNCAQDGEFQFEVVWPKNKKKTEQKQEPDKVNISCGGTNRCGDQRGHMFTWI